jgi:hypothetical protein
MRYRRGNTTVIVGEWATIRIADNKVFIGRPTAEQLESWRFTLVEEHQPTAEELLEQARMERLVALDEYDSSDSVNSFTLNGNPMWLDYATRQQLRISIEAYRAQGIEQVTKWFSGVQYTFPTATWLQMLNALEVYASEALNVTEAHRAAINALTSIEEIDDYDFTIGYPKKIEL